MRRKDPRAIEALYDRLSRQAFGLAYRILGDGGAAEDIVQEAFMTVWRQSEKIDPARGKLNSLLLTIVHHRAIDALRASRGQTSRQIPLDLDAVEKTGPDVTDRIIASLDRAAVRRALEGLPPDQRRPIEMAYFEGLTHVEIAEALEQPLGTIKSRLRLGLDKMRSALGAKRSA